jgi:hypothetical protein
VDDVARTGLDELSVPLDATDARRPRHDTPLRGRPGELYDTAPGRAADLRDGLVQTTETPSLPEAANRAGRRMEVVQAVRKLRRNRERAA